MRIESGSTNRPFPGCGFVLLFFAPLLFSAPSLHA